MVVVVGTGLEVLALAAGDDGASPNVADPAALLAGEAMFPYRAPATISLLGTGASDDVMNPDY